MRKYLLGREVAETIKTCEPELMSLSVNEDHSVNSSEMFADSESRPPTPSLRKEPEPVKVERAFPPHQDTSKLRPGETMELLTRVSGATEEDLNLCAISAALETKLGFANLKKLPQTVLPGVQFLTRDVKSFLGFRSSPEDTCPSLFHHPVRIVPFRNVDVTSEFVMKIYGLAALVPLAITHTPLPTDATGATDGCGRGTKAIATANL